MRYSAVTDDQRIDSELLDAQRELRALADEQAALRRVATLVARGAPQDEVFAAVGREAGALLSADGARIVRYVDDGIELLPGWSATGQAPLPAESRLALSPTSVTSQVLRTGRMTRIDNYAENVAPSRDDVRGLGIQSAVGAPIVVGGRVWGAVIAWLSRAARLPEGAEARLAGFTELAATAVSNAANRAELDRVLAEQAALRRVAELVARETPPDVVLAAVAREVGEMLGVDGTDLARFEDDSVVSVAQWGRQETVAIGARFPLDGESISARVRRTGRPARLDDYGDASGTIAQEMRRIGIECSIGVPITVDGRPWGVMVASSCDADPFPGEAESRLQDFTELVATAISNAEARSEVARLADEQFALRRVATLVAEGASPNAVFDAVTAEVAELVGASAVSLARYDGDELVVLATRGLPFANVGDRYPLGGANVVSAVLRTGRTARLDDVSETTGRIGEVAQASGARSTVGAPIVVDGRTWGVLAAIWSDRGPPPEDTEERLAKFTRLLDSAIANADSRDQLTASRARVLAAADEARRRVVRDLHDGAQQRLVQTIVTLKLARQDSEHADELTAEALETAERAMVELRELAHGILPAALTRGGLRAGVAAFVTRLDLPVELDLTSERLHPDIEASAYFIVAEALTNVVKHAKATKATVRAAVEDGALTLEVADDGVGGADPEGHGLVGLADRVAAHGGSLRIDSTDSTVLSARLPL